MQDKRPGRVFSSLFSKLLLMLLLTGVSINLLVVGFFVHRIRHPVRIVYWQNVMNYLEYIVDDLGVPPDFEKAQTISRRYSIQIQYNGPGQDWQTSDFNLPEDMRHWRTVAEGRNYHVRALHGRGVATIYRGKERFQLVVGRSFASDPGAHAGIGLLILTLSIIVLGAYLALRWLLKPIQWLHGGVGQISAGNVDYRVPGTRSDQLGDLVAAFNQMAERICGMLQDRNQLLLDVSHELRTPLTRMKVALEFLPEGRAKCTLSEDVGEMEKLVTTLLEEARLRHGKIDKKPFDIKTLLKEVIEEFGNRRPDVVINYDASPSPVVIAPELIRIVFRNVIDNALKYSDPKGSPVVINVDKTDEETVVRVSDSGIGIPPKDLRRVFEPFYRVDKSRSRDTGGYGIGLSLCKTIMEAHGGGIEIESVPESGSVLILKFSRK